RCGNRNATHKAAPPALRSANVAVIETSRSTLRHGCGTPPRLSPPGRSARQERPGRNGRDRCPTGGGTGPPSRPRRPARTTGTPVPTDRDPIHAPTLPEPLVSPPQTRRVRRVHRRGWRSRRRRTGGPTWSTPHGAWVT